MLPVGLPLTVTVYELVEPGASVVGPEIATATFGSAPGPWHEPQPFRETPVMPLGKASTEAGCDANTTSQVSKPSRLAAPESGISFLILRPHCVPSGIRARVSPPSSLSGVGCRPGRPGRGAARRGLRPGDEGAAPARRAVRHRPAAAPVVRARRPRGWL